MKLSYLFMISKRLPLEPQPLIIGQSKRSSEHINDASEYKHDILYSTKAGCANFVQCLELQVEGWFGQTRSFEEKWKDTA